MYVHARVYNARTYVGCTLITTYVQRLQVLNSKSALSIKYDLLNSHMMFPRIGTNFMRQLGTCSRVKNSRARRNEDKF